ncbi:DNA-binding protein [Mycetohabitans sp. B46]|uniref:DNA-binding protein n=1 Tax=Mycetohabitans sp. B46 TaxID=2772536 RepID=UPI003FD34B55
MHKRNDIEDGVNHIELEIEWTEAASKKIEKLMPRTTRGDEPYIALPPIECLPVEGDVLFLGPPGKQQPFIVAERQYHHEGEADWTIILILDVVDAH